jgi:UDP-glucuronate 4-epimerase
VKIALTGAAGFIGSHTCESLVRRGHEVVGIDSFDGTLYPSNVKRANAAALDDALGARFRLVEADICDRAAMQQMIGDRSIDVVCHLAALAGVRPSLANPARYIRTNLEGTTNLLEAMRAAGHARLVFASSSSVYGSRGEPGALDRVTAFREDDPCLTPASPYAATKRAGELLCSTYRDLYGIGASCLRFFTVYGPRQRHDMAIHQFVTAVAGGRPITLYGDGSTRRDYTFIDDIVAGTVAAIERVAPAAFAIYNLGGTRTTSLAELVALIERTVGRSAVIERRPLAPGDVPVTYADITDAQRDLGYSPTTPIAEGIDRFWQWLSARTPPAG